MKKSTLLLIIFFWLLILLFLTIITGWLYWERRFIFGFLEAAEILLGLFVGTMSLAIAVVSYLNRRRVLARIRKWFFRSEFENAGQPFLVPPQEFHAAVIPVSRKEQPEWIFHHLKPQYVSLLYTREMKEVAIQLAHNFSIEPYNITFFPDAESMVNDINIVGSPDRPDNARAVARMFIEHYLHNNIERQNIFVDTTGGKVPMSIGVFQAAEELDVSSFYVVGMGKAGHINKPHKKEEGYPVFVSDFTSNTI